MFRYVALVWDDREPSQAAAATAIARQLSAFGSDWHAQIQVRGLAVYCTGIVTGRAQSYLLPKARGVVLGRLFERSYDGGAAPINPAFDEGSATEAIRSDAESISAKYWGRYVAFTRDEERHRTTITRDPSGEMLCFATRYHGVTVYFSRLADCVRAVPLTFSVNWKYLRGYLVFNDLPSRETGLNEVWCVQPGERIVTDAQGEKSEFFWNPMRLAQTAVIEDFQSAVRELGSVVRSCVSAWASCHDSILHNLSGGLDSSIVAACLASAPTRPRVLCWNQYSEGSNTDERKFARLVAARLGYELLEQRRNDTYSFLPMLSMPRCPLPSSYLGYFDSVVEKVPVMKQGNITAMCSGAGGDPLFYVGGEWLAAADFVYRHPCHPRLVRVASDLAYLSRLSVWRVLGGALRKGFRRSPWNPLEDAAQYRTLLTHDTLQSAQPSEFLHPIFRQAQGVPPGKLNQMYTLIYLSNYRYNPFEGTHDPDNIAPLLSQPLVELILRIPSYVLTANAQDRAVARQAFSGILPNEIIYRRSKGGMEEHVRALLLKNLSIVKGLLLDGVLVQQGLIDHVKLNEVLSLQPSTLGTYMSELYSYIEAESWVRSWVHGEQSAAAVA
jgi:Asparagine synthase (glutamine-hydrolyzing)